MKHNIFRFFFALLFFFSPSLASHTFSEIRTVVDEVGREVLFHFPPKRIISLAPNMTEILFGLGLNEQIVGVSNQSDFPEEAKHKPRVGSYLSVNFEQIISLRPELIVATGAGNTRAMVDRLETMGYPAYVVFPRNFDGILHSVLRLGWITGREKEASAIVQSMKERTERVAERTKGLSRPRVFLQIGEVPLVTVGKGSFANDMIHLAGGENIAGSEKEMYPRLGMEEILRRSPEVILISSMNPTADYQRPLKEWYRWKTIPAVRNGRVHLMDSDVIDRPSPRIIDGLEAMAHFLHPEKF